MTVNYNQTDVHILSETGNMVRTMLGEYDLPNDTSGTLDHGYCLKMEYFNQFATLKMYCINVIMYASYKRF